MQPCYFRWLPVEAAFGFFHQSRWCSACVSTCVFALWVWHLHGVLCVMFDVSAWLNTCMALVAVLFTPTLCVCIACLSVCVPLRQLTIAHAPMGCHLVRATMLCAHCERLSAVLVRSSDVFLLQLPKVKTLYCIALLPQCCDTCCEQRTCRGLH